MIIEVGADLKITNINSQEQIKLVNYLTNNLKIPNPQFFRLQKMGKWTGKTPQYIILYSKLQNGFLVPFGALHDVYRLFPHADYQLKFQKHNDVLNYKSRIKPYDYQRVAIDKVVKAKNGVLVAPCGAGKTEMALQIIAEVGLPALWVTHTQDLLKQSFERATKNFELPKQCFGTITDGKINIGNYITLATVQTLSKIDLNKIKDQFGIIIVDECHRVGGSPTNIMMFYKCLSNLSARYKIGVTATPKKNGLEKSMYSLLGDLIYEIPKEAVANKLCDVEIINCFTHYKPDIKMVTSTDGTLDHTKMIDDLTKNNDRNKYIIEFLKSNLESCIVLSERVAHLQYLFNNCGIAEASMLTSHTPKKQRENVIDDFKSGKIKMLFTTYQLMSEGFDCPSLRSIVLATPQKNEKVVTQSIGRVARKCDGKTKGIVYDMVDDWFVYNKMRKEREKVYKKNNYEFNKI